MGKEELFNIIKKYIPVVKKLPKKIKVEPLPKKEEVSVLDSKIEKEFNPKKAEKNIEHKVKEKKKVKIDKTKDKKITSFWKAFYSFF